MDDGLSILVAEDEALVAEMSRGVLEDLGHRVAGFARTGAEAVEKTLALAPDLVLMDVRMPDMDGIDAAGHLNDLCPTPVVILSAYESPETIDRASAAGVGAYLIKPPNGREMARAITIAVARFRDLAALRKLNAELRQALATVRTLSGLLPICSGCKRIRDDKGYWQQVEEYVQTHTQAEFTHSVCPECVKKFYPDYSPGT